MDSEVTPSDLSELLGPRADEASRELGKTIEYLLGRMAAMYRLGREDFEDLRQEILSYCLQHALRIRDGKAEILQNKDAWLCRVSHNAVLSQKRRQLSRPQDGAGWPEGFNPPAPKVLSHEERLAVRQALSALDEKCRRLLILRDVFQESRRLIAEMLRITANALGARLFRCRKKLLGLFRDGTGIMNTK